MAFDEGQGRRHAALGMAREQRPERQETAADGLWHRDHRSRTQDDAAGGGDDGLCAVRADGEDVDTARCARYGWGDPANARLVAYCLQSVAAAFDQAVRPHCDGVRDEELDLHTHDAVTDSLRAELARR